MKLGLVISTQATIFSAVRHDTDLGTSIQKAAALGYDGVELAVRDPDAVDILAVKALVEKYRLDVPAIGTGQAFLEEGLSFTARDKHVRDQAIKRIKAHVQFAAALHANVIIGLVRGRGDAENVPHEQNIGWMDEAIEECARYAAGENVDFLVEPLNRYETTLLNSAEDVIALIHRISRKNIKLLMDTFHMNIEESSLDGSIVRSMPYLGHVHFADSNRRAPGQGHLNFRDIMSVLMARGYGGYISMEMLPWPTADEAATLSVSFVKSMLAEGAILQS